ncbi:MAG: hypothetical protein QXL51_03715 [Candidatus Aenigmatarchaeota archaeon]
MKHSRLLIVLFIVAFFISYSIWIALSPTYEKVEKAKLFVKINHMGKLIINNTTLVFSFLTETPINLTSAYSETYGNLSIVIINENTFNVTIKYLKPNYSASFIINNITFKSSQVALNETFLPKMSIKINGIASIPPHWKDVSFERSLRLFNKGFSVKSEYIYPFVNVEDKIVIEEVPMLRIFVKEVLFIFILSLVLIIIGIFLIFNKFISWLRHPLFTHIILLINTFTYVFIGTGNEVNLLPELSWFKTYLPLSIFYHADIDHLIFNLVYFLIISTLAETWLNVKSKMDAFIYYISPFIFNAILDISRIISYGYLPMGLSFVVILLTINVWAYILKNWKQVIKKRVDVLVTLLSGIPMFSLINWTLYLLLSEKIIGAFNTSLALSHVIMGIIGLIMVFIITITNVIVEKIFNHKTS